MKFSLSDKLEIAYLLPLTLLAALLLNPSVIPALLGKEKK